MQAHRQSRGSLPRRILSCVGDLTIDEAAGVLGVNASALRRWPPDKLPFHVVGARRDRRYRSDDIAAYLETRTAADSAASALVERAREAQEIQRTMVLAARQAELAGEAELARRIRHVRSIVNDRLRFSG